MSPSEVHNDIWTERANALVRHLVTVLFAGAFVWGFIISQTVSADAFGTLAGGVVTWWFKSRDEEKTTKATIAATTAAATAATAAERQR